MNREDLLRSYNFKHESELTANELIICKLRQKSNEFISLNRLFTTIFDSEIKRDYFLNSGGYTQLQLEYDWTLWYYTQYDTSLDRCDFCLNDLKKTHSRRIKYLTLRKTVADNYPKSYDVFQVNEKCLTHLIITLKLSSYNYLLLLCAHNDVESTLNVLNMDITHYICSKIIKTCYVDQKCL